MTGALLEVENLTVSYQLGRRLTGRARTLTAVQDVTFDIRAGETFGLVGESGSGKTTVGRSILRLVEPAGGRVVFAGTDIDSFGMRTPLQYRREVQVIFQDPTTSLNPRQTVGTTLAQVIARHETASRSAVRQKVLATIDLVGLARHHAAQYPHELSGGQRQRVAVARAVAVRPRLIVCDEPVSALDVSTRGQIINLLADLQQELGVSYLLIAHDLDLVRHVSARVGVMFRGRLVERGPTHAVFTAPAHPYTQMLLDSILVPNPRREGTRRERRRRDRQRADVPDRLNAAAGCPFHTRCPAATEQCGEVAPALRPVEPPARWAACHYAEEIAESRRSATS